MKVLILTPQVHFHSPAVMRKIFELHKDSNIEFSVIITPKISSNEKSPASFKRIINDSGLKYLFYMVLMKLKFDFYRRLETLFPKEKNKRKFLSPEEICQLCHIDCHIIDKINSEKALELVNRISPDIAICIFFNQILKKDFINSIKGECLNLHPSLLPKYRGMSPVLWMLSEGAEKGGATLHHITKELDAGNIISQKSVDFSPNESFFTAYRKSAEAGSDLINELLSSGPCPEGDPQPGTGKIYGPFTREALKQLLKKYSFLKF
jgi:hypothetical protein